MFILFQPCTYRHQHRLFSDLQWCNLSCTLLRLSEQFCNPLPRRTWKKCCWLLSRWLIWCQLKTFMSLLPWSSLRGLSCKRFTFLDRIFFIRLGFLCRRGEGYWCSFHGFSCSIRPLWLRLGHFPPVKCTALTIQPTHRQKQHLCQSWDAQSNTHTRLIPYFPQASF